jgi:hypothetical protein
MEPHIKVARAHRALAFLYAFVAVLNSLMFLSELNHNAKIGLVANRVIFACFYALHLSISLGAFRQRPWARTLSQITGWLLVLGFPVGTIIGLYLIVVSWTKWTTASVSSGPSTEPGTGLNSPALS